MKPYIKAIVVGSLITMCVGLTYYFHYVLRTQVIFTHLFYLPIVLSSIFWKRFGVLIALLLGVLILTSQAISSIDLSPSDFVRSGMFVLVAGVVTYLTNLNKEFSTKIEQSEAYKSLNVQLIEKNSQLEKALETLKIQEEELKKLIATKDRFFSILAHDLRNPFNSIVGITELLRKNIRSYEIERTEKLVGAINSAAIKTYSLLDNLLEWGRIQTGTNSFNPEIFNVSKVIDENIDFVADTALSKNITISFSKTITPNVFADSNMIKVVIRNLLSNAIKFTPIEGAIQVELNPHNGCALVRISDNGVGVPDEIKSKLFSVSHNISTFGTAKETGSGLGLMICKELVERNGGEIWVESLLQKGSTFSFTIPFDVDKKN